MIDQVKKALWDKEPLARWCPKCRSSIHEGCKSLAILSKGQYLSPGHYHAERMPAIKGAA